MIKPNSNPEIDTWTQSNLIEIELSLRHILDIRLRQRGMRTLMTSPRYFDEDRRWLSEMPLCNLWQHGNSSDGRLQPPEGFTVYYGSVSQTTQFGLISKGHFFAYDGKHVLCLTPGQYVQPYDNLKPGDRTRILKEAAPDYVTSYGRGVVRLFGPLDDINEQLQTLSIRYKFK